MQAQWIAIGLTIVTMGGGLFKIALWVHSKLAVTDERISNIKGDLKTCQDQTQTQGVAINTIHQTLARIEGKLEFIVEEAKEHIRRDM